MRDWPAVVTYIAACACATYLVGAGKLPSELLAALIAVAIPSPFSKGDKS